jgi:hypothetical protein
MTRFVKLTAFSGLGLACLTMPGGAQTPPTPASNPPSGLPGPVPDGRFGGGPGGAPGAIGGFGGGGFGAGGQGGSGGGPGGFGGFVAGGPGGAAGGVGGTGAMFGAVDPFEGEVRKLAKQLAETKDQTEREKARDHLKELLNKQFDDRQKRHDKEIESLEAQVKKLKDMVSKRQDNKKEIIDERSKQLEREAKGLGW